ncbi:hypothetical protein ECG_04365 [Echinococcus granulosus]|nr:hypothetical protein ECG_04365 [Echinococcus granulosus]
MTQHVPPERLPTQSPEYSLCHCGDCCTSRLCCFREHGIYNINKLCIIKFTKKDNFSTNVLQTCNLFRCFLIKTVPASLQTTLIFFVLVRIKWLCSHAVSSCGRPLSCHFHHFFSILVIHIFTVVCIN